MTLRLPALRDVGLAAASVVATLAVNRRRRALAECAQRRGVETLRIHHSDEGNRWVAERVAEALRTRSAPLP